MDLTNTQDFEKELAEKKQTNNSKVKEEKKSDGKSKKEKSEHLNIYHLLRDFNKVGDIFISDRQRSILYELESMGLKKRPSHGYLAYINNSSDTTIKRELDKLKEIGVIRWDRYNNATNWYYLNEILIKNESKKSLTEWQSRFQEELNDGDFILRYPEWRLDRSEK